MKLEYKNVFALVFLLVFYTTVHALTKETTIKTSNSSLPLVQVKTDDRRTSWSAFKSDGIGSVGLFWLGREDAEMLVSISEKAEDLYKQIIEQGRCPTGKIKSGEIGKLTSNNNSMKFEVICERNNILVQVTMIDQYAINVIFSFVEWQDIYKLGKDILKHYP